jgi:hypothetical protein
MTDAGAPAVVRHAHAPVETNALLRPIGVVAVPHLPCSDGCAATIQLARTLLQLARGNGICVDPETAVCEPFPTRCPPISFGGLTILPCCNARKTCGYVRENVCFDPHDGDPDGGAAPDGGPVIVRDPACSPVTVLGVTLEGCCLLENQCGYVFPTFGCISADTVRHITASNAELPDGGIACLHPR